MLQFCMGPRLRGNEITTMLSNQEVVLRLIICSWYVGTVEQIVNIPQLGVGMFHPYAGVCLFLKR